MNTLAPVKKIDIRTQAATALQNHILLNSFKPGDKLPSERALAEKLNIGRNSLREALRKLEAIGMVEVINGKGTFIKKVTENIVNLQIEATKVNFLELLQIRRVLENLVIDNIIKNATENDFKTFKKKLMKFENACETGINIEDSDTEFHHSIYKANGNHALYELIKPTADTFHELWLPIKQNNNFDDVFINTLDMHKTLYNALNDGDSKKAKDVMHKILDFDKELMSSLIPTNN